MLPWRYFRKTRELSSTILLKANKNMYLFKGEKYLKKTQLQRMVFSTPNGLSPRDISIDGLITDGPGLCYFSTDVENVLSTM